MTYNMKRNWDVEALIEYFTFMPNEFKLLSNKVGETRLGFAVMFKFFQNEARFANNRNEVPPVVVSYIAKQLNMNPHLFYKYNIASRSFYYHKVQIRDFFGFEESTIEGAEKIIKEMFNGSITYDMDIAYLKEEVYKKFRELKIEPPISQRIERIINSNINSLENEFFSETYKRLSKDCLINIDKLITRFEKEEDNATANSEFISFSELRADAGRTSLESVFTEINKLKAIRSLNLTQDLFKNLSPKLLKKYKQRVITEDIYEIRRHPEQVKYSLLSAFFWVRSCEISDNLIELLIQVIHKIAARSERKVQKNFINDLKRVSGKTNILYLMAEKLLANPDGIIKDTIYPEIKEQTLKDIVNEFKNTGSAYKQKVYTVMRTSYRSTANKYLQDQ